MSGMLTRARALSSQALKVINNVAKQQFAVSMKSDAVLNYERHENGITFIDTQVPKEFQGKGVGKILAQYAFGYALEHKLNVTCKCHFLAKYYQDNIDKYKNLKVTLQLE